MLGWISFGRSRVEQSIAETDEPERRLKKDLGVLDLLIFGVGVIIGAGIFVVTGTVAKTNSGPAITISFAIAGLACALAALCYAEFASTLPVAGSAYTFSYASFGEVVAWIIGWDLALEFTIGAAALSTSFSGYFQEVFEGTFLEVPTSLGPVVPYAGDLRRRHRVRAAVRLPDAQPHRRHLGAVHRVDGHRPGRARVLRLPPLPARPGRDHPGAGPRRSLAASLAARMCGCAQ